MEIGPDDREKIRTWAETLTGEHRVGLIPEEGDAGRRIARFLDELTRLVPAVRIEKKDGDGQPGPAILMGNQVRYRAVPTGRELDPFLLLVKGFRAAADALPAEVQSALHRIEVPALVKTYIASDCPFCPETVRRLLILSGACPSLYITVIDGALFPEEAQKDGVRSVPTVILDDGFRWIGLIRESELIDMILNRDPARMGAESFRKIIEDGSAEGLARMMTASGEIYPAFIDLLSHERWSIRLGAMVVFEYLLEESRALALRVISPLWDRFDRAGDPVKGDILHVLGETRHPDLRERLARVSGGNYAEEVREAAAEALDKLR